MATGKIIKVKEYEWTNPKYGMVIKEWKLGNKILCQISRQGEGYRGEGEYLVRKPHSGFVNAADTLEEAERKAHQLMAWDAEWDEIVSGGKSIMKGKRTNAPQKKCPVKVNFKKML